jgi:hypothetical protein
MIINPAPLRVCSIVDLGTKHRAERIRRTTRCSSLWSCVLSWTSRFTDPTLLPDGKKLSTAREAITCEIWESPRLAPVGLSRYS